jgi:hypothetical protein
MIKAQIALNGVKIRNHPNHFFDFLDFDAILFTSKFAPNIFLCLYQNALESIVNQQYYIVLCNLHSKPL